MNIILLGKPGSGKGTCCNLLQEQGYTILPTGDLLRAEIKKGTTIGKEIELLFKEGKMAPVYLTNQLVTNFLQENKDKNVILDAYPRNEEQYQASKGLFDKLIILDCPDEIVKNRLMFREVHVPSGRVYNLKNNPPKNAGLDDITNEPLTKRADDTPEIIEKRLSVFYHETFPVIEKLKNDLETLVIETNKKNLIEQLSLINQFIQLKFNNKVKIK